ncbi:type II toxin-antitoxin system RelE/ParE family toxin [Dyadobacter subterraneus]|uniref:Type II toxin-antitoxin system RelE/ParE family toxin n=1 Tax=Dyadobacter subterraneus TaxID=2773304 RepID=A0ABR9WJW1_9BACT|nr:type II toxin-antitoxin system RelE/ParE family toxin [Dyadobacter subterraneus]MBE9465678.1 type II toxin-antitoxin system RelE/ParE family toxin [Dyadobacter subterraneus]
MEDEILEVVISEQSLLSLEEIFMYGIETFSHASASIFIDELNLQIQSLSKDYLHHPECRYLATKSKKYRNIRCGSYLVIYKITMVRVEVLNIIHASRSISRIKATRKIKI